MGGNKDVSTDYFLNYTDNKNRTAIYGKWIIEELAINKIRLHRTFWSILGKNVTEEFIVEIDLRSDLKTILTKVRKSNGLLGMFGL
jgi:hypothetical protein